MRKNCLRGFRQSEFQTSLHSYRDYLENWNFTCSKFTYDTFQKANNKGADQTARMRRLVCACVVRKPPNTGFLASRPKTLSMFEKQVSRILSNYWFFKIKSLKGGTGYLRLFSDWKHTDIANWCITKIPMWWHLYDLKGNRREKKN